MEGMNDIAFRIVSFVGTARSAYINAIHAAKDGDFEGAEAMIKQGDEAFVLGHHAHADLVQREAAGDTVTPSLLLVHAEDQLMSAEGFKIVALEMIDMYRQFSK